MLMKSKKKKTKTSDAGEASQSIVDFLVSDGWKVIGFLGKTGNNGNSKPGK